MPCSTNLLFNILLFFLCSMSCSLLEPEESIELTRDLSSAEDSANVTTRPTNVSISEYYSECVNINTEIEKLTASLGLTSDESCATLYRFPPLAINYTLTFSDGSQSDIEVELKLQDSQRTADNTTVTLTGDVVEGYLRGAYFQQVITYPSLDDRDQCLTESGITSLQSISASITVILVPNAMVGEDTESSKGPQAFDCFGRQSIKYLPGLK